jgi:hypothetical protein
VKVPWQWIPEVCADINQDVTKERLHTANITVSCDETREIIQGLLYGDIHRGEN